MAVVGGVEVVDCLKEEHLGLPGAFFMFFLIDIYKFFIKLFGINICFFLCLMPNVCIFYCMPNWFYLNFNFANVLFEFFLR